MVQRHIRYSSPLSGFSGLVAEASLTQVSHKSHTQVSHTSLAQVSRKSHTCHRFPHMSAHMSPHMSHSPFSPPRMSSPPTPPRINEFSFFHVDGQGRHYLLHATAEQQQQMVFETLSKLLTPVMPLVYRPFMAGSLGGRRWGPWFYAPAMTALVTPPFFKFLVGPSRPNLRRDGRPGGLLVEKCRFLQESNCKGICLQMCKLPAQRYFSETLGMPLRSIIPLNPLAPPDPPTPCPPPGSP